MKKRTIFFDLGNVLIFFDLSKMWRQIADYTGLELINVQEVMQHYTDPYERGIIDSKILHRELGKMARKELHFETLMHALSDIFQPNTATLSIAQKLKQRGHRLFLLSNTCDAHFQFISSQFEFLKFFDGYILSYEVGARKPEKKIYEKALEIAGCGNEECFYTDDILLYVETARSFRIDAEQYTTPQALTQHLNIRGML